MKQIVTLELKDIECFYVSTVLHVKVDYMLIDDTTGNEVDNMRLLFVSQSGVDGFKCINIDNESFQYKYLFKSTPEKDFSVTNIEYMIDRFMIYLDNLTINEAKILIKNYKEEGIN